MAVQQAAHINSRQWYCISTGACWGPSTVHATRSLLPCLQRPPAAPHAMAAPLQTEAPNSSKYHNPFQGLFAQPGRQGHMAMCLRPSGPANDGDHCNYPNVHLTTIEMPAFDVVLPAVKQQPSEAQSMNIIPDGTGSSWQRSPG